MRRREDQMQVSTRGLRQVGKSSQSIGVRTALGQALLSISFRLFPSFPTMQILYQPLFPSSSTPPRHSNNPFPIVGVFYSFHDIAGNPLAARHIYVKSKATRSESADVSSRTQRQTNASLKPRTTNLPHHEGHRQAVACYCPVAVGYR